MATFACNFLVQFPHDLDCLEVTHSQARFSSPDFVAIISKNAVAPDTEQPVVYWVPSIAPSGMAFYQGDLFPEWRGDLFVGALAGRHLRRLELAGDTVTAQEELLSDLGARIRDVESGPDGHLYLLTDSSNGRLIRLDPPAP